MSKRQSPIVASVVFALTWIVISGNVSPVSADIANIAGLSNAAFNSLVAHYDGRRHVSTTGSNVDSWTPVDGSGNMLAGMTIDSTPRGSGAADLITYDGSGTLSFDDTSDSSEGRFLSGALSNSNSTDFTVFWRGHYNAGAPFENSGTYAFNIGLNDLAHQRDNSGGGFIVELYNGSTFGGDDITAFDGTVTNWSTVVTASSHSAYANGIDLNVSGAPSYNIAENADFVVGAFGSSGFDFVGDISQIVIFESALSDSDRILVENYLSATAVPEPAGATLFVIGGLGLFVRRRKRA